jgi:hypothetical protein
MATVDLMTNDLTVHQRYKPALGHPRKRYSLSRSWLSAATSPILGSSILFPGYFDRAVERLLNDPSAMNVTPAAARWYFGQSLVFQVHPARLKRRISDFVLSAGGLRWMGTSFLDAADWSAVLAPIEKSPVHQEVTAILAAQLDFRSTRNYQRQLRSIAAGRPIARNGVRLASPAALDAYYYYCVALIKSARKHGIVPRERFGPSMTFGLKHRRARPTFVESSERNIGVAISENGELVRHLGGKHRTAIAQAMGFAAIPVELRLIHVGWLAKEMERTGLPAYRALGQFLKRLGTGSESICAPGRDARKKFQ